MNKNNFLVIEKEGTFHKQEFEIVRKNLPEIEEKKECEIKTPVTNKEDSKEEKKKISRTKCEVYSRVVGYFRPVQQWNEGKQAEWNDRKVFKISPIAEIKNI